MRNVKTGKVDFYDAKFDYDKNGLPVNEYYTEELIKPIIDKKKALKNQKYYIGASILLMSIVLISILCS